VTALRGLAVSITLLCFTGCTTLQPLADFSPSTLRQEVEVGDRVQLVTLEGVAYDLTVTRVDADALHGHGDTGKQYKVMFEAIRTIRVEKLSGWKVATGFGVTVAALAVLAMLAVIYAFTQLDDE